MEQDDYSLNAARVTEVFVDCLFKDEEDKTNYVEAQGVMVHVGFHPGRLEEHKEEILAMLGELPDQFKASGGGGWTFLNACNDKHGNQWTGLHKVMDELFTLGIAIGKVKPNLEREAWKMLPGGMPYYVVDL